MKIFKIILSISVILFSSNILCAQWMHRDQIVHARKIIEDLYAYHDLTLSENRFPIDTTRWLMNNSYGYLESIKGFHQGIDTLKKYTTIPPFVNRMEFSPKLLKHNDSLQQIAEENLKAREKIQSFFGGRASALQYLIDNGSKYPPSSNIYTLSLIKENSKFIQTELERSIDAQKRFHKFIKSTYEYVPPVQFFTLYSYLNLPESYKDSLLKYPEIPLVVRARLGDTLAEQKIIKKFWKLVNDTVENMVPREYVTPDELLYYPFERANDNYFAQVTDQLFQIDSEKTWDAFFSALRTNKGTYYHLERSSEGWYIYRPVTYKLLHAYNLYFGLELYFFENIKKQSELGYYFYFEAIERYLSDKHNRDVKIFK